MSQAGGRWPGARPVAARGRPARVLCARRPSPRGAPFCAATLDPHPKSPYLAFIFFSSLGSRMLFLVEELL